MVRPRHQHPGAHPKPRPQHPPGGQSKPRLPHPSAPSLPSRFPACATQVLEDVRRFVAADLSGCEAAAGELQTRLDRDFYGFDGKRSEWNPVQWLHLTELVCQFYENIKEPTEIRNRFNYFTVFFCGRELASPEHELRMKFLTQLCSLALQFDIYTLFDDVAAWLMKLDTNDHAIQIVNRLVVDFVHPNSKLGLIDCVLPLHTKALEFSCYFLVFSIDEKNLRPQLVSVLGKWMTEELSEILRILAENRSLGAHFREQCFPLLIRYNIEQSGHDEVHDRLHCALLYLLLQWRPTFESAADRKSPELLPLDSLVDFIVKSDRLHEFQRQRLTQCVQNSHRSGQFPIHLFRRRVPEFENCYMMQTGQLAELIDE